MWWLKERFFGPGHEPVRERRPRLEPQQLSEEQLRDLDECLRAISGDLDSWLEDTHYLKGIADTLQDSARLTYIIEKHAIIRGILLNLPHITWDWVSEDEQTD